jgi:hypothetical protein
MRLPSNREPLPRVDEHLVEPEVTRDEVVRGQRIQAQPAKEPHADRHTRLDYVTAANVAEGYVVAADLLTRVGPQSDFATDVCVRRDGIDPATGTRYLEELAFEIVSEQSLRSITVRAEDLANRGVRRVIAIFVKTDTVREWSPERAEWVTLPSDGVLQDPTLIRPVPIRALLDAGAAHDAVIDAHDERNSPRMAAIKAAQFAQGAVRGIEQGVEQGRKQALEKAIAVACELLTIPFGPAERARIEPLDATGLEALLERIRAERRWPPA